MLQSYPNSFENSYFKSVFEENEKIFLKNLQGISELVKAKQTKTWQPKNLHINKRIETNGVKIASKFISLFSTIAGKIDGKIISTFFAFRNTLKEPTENSKFLSRTKVNEVQSVIKELQG